MRILTYGIPEPQVPLHSNERHDGRLKFLLLGTIEERKGQKVLVEALRQLPAATLEKIDVQIVGRAHDPEIAQEIKAAVREIACLSYADSVTHEEALSLIAGTDVMLSASWDETGPLILIEALALGRAIVSTSVGGVAEHLVSEGAGLFFAPGDAAALAQAIRRLVDEPALVSELTAKARSAYIDYFVFDRFGGEFIDLVNEAIELSRAGHDSKQRLPETLEAAG
jgi:glycosyltransferase involved in cell wall biosynthesis